ncbi:MAG TPA: PKD domain-containing protein [Chitinophagaceae bacterium]|nr:PKD domain-containing protein [Chitinophagaceae bacterium]
MKVILSSVALLIYVLVSINASAQYLQFVENKGQWDKNTQFKGSFANGAVIIKPDGGYRVMLYNTDDLQRIARYIHGKPAAGSEINRGGETVAGAHNSTGQGFVLRSHAYEITFANGNPHPVITSEKPLTQYNNYFIGSDPSKWAGGCKIYTAITVKNIYPGIDVHYYTNNGNFKYDIIVHPGADISKISLQIDGATGLDVKNGNFLISTSVGTVTELKPNTYAVTSTGNQPIGSRYSLNGKSLTFKVDKAVSGATMVIDPTVIFCSFSGSRYDNWGYTATYDNAGNFYAGGIVFGTGFQVTNGAYQTTFAGGNNSTGEGRQGNGNGTPDIDLNGFDIGIMKFSSSGNAVQYATYIGGSEGNEQPHSIVADETGNLVIAGRSNSGDYPTLGIKTIGPCGGQDIILTKLSAGGDKLLGSLRIGGTGDDGVNIKEKDLQPPSGSVSIRRNYGDDARSEVILDGSDNIYLASCTKSSDFPTVNAFQKNLQGTQDAVLLKFSPGLNSQPLFCTYLGGNGNDAAFVLRLEPGTNNIYTCGATSSNNFPGTSGVSSAPLSGKFLGGDCDGFITILKNDGSALVKSVYFGTAAADQIYGIDFGKTGNPIITGTTEGVVTPVNSPFNANGNQASGKQFITKLKPDLSGIVYSANFGPNTKYPNISPTAFLVDVCENVYVSGWGGGLDNSYTNSGPQGLVYKANGNISAPLKSSITSNRGQDVGDFYFFVLEKNASSQLFGAFMGDPNDYDGIHVDGGTSRFDKAGVIYQAVCTCGPDGTLPVNAVYSTNGAAAANIPYYCNLTSIKIAFDLAGVRSAVKSSIRNISNDTSGCVPVKVSFVDTIGNAQTYMWHFGDGSADTTTKAVSVTHTYNKVGTYKVMLIAIDSSTCNIADTSYLNIRVRNDPASVGFTDKKLLPCDSLNYIFINQSSAPPGKPFNGSSFTWDFGDGTTVTTDADTVKHHYNASGTYNVVLNLTDTNYCNAPEADSIKLNIAVNVAALFSQPAAGCAPYTVQFDNTSTGGDSFTWNFGDGSASSNETSPVHTYTVPGTYIVKLVAANATSCNKSDSISFPVVVNGIPAAAFSFSPLPALENTPSTFTNTSQNAVSYKWDFGDGSGVSTTRIDTVITHTYNKTGTYTACLTATNAAGCRDSVCQQVPAIITPLVDVPNAFTPNGDGINDNVYIRGFGIDKVTWQIYNRWGMVVFSTTDKNAKWDGRYKGTLQPQEVYVYSLDVQFTDGTRYHKTGDITLLR